MRSVSQEELLNLQSQPKFIRNICILAHVDHGKTTLADALLASNGIISNRLAGKLRYLDSLPEEQLRGITMKSSAISLLFKKDPNSFLINLTDSPGHIDFSSEVSTAVRLCDGAIIVVDVVEGVCPQTHAVLRQAWLEGIKPCLVLNKMDRLITELKQTPIEAFMHLQKILEQVNAVTGTLFSSDVLEKTSATQQSDCQSNEESQKDLNDWSSGLEDVDDSSLYFSPEQGNVVFASAIDGWGFRVNDFAELYAKKIGVRSDVLIKTLWGDYYLQTKNKRIMKGAQAKARNPLFVQFILNYIWEVYETVCVRRDKDRIEKIVQSLNLKISARDSRQSDSKTHLKAIFHQWLPLSRAVLEMVVSKLPSPLDMNPERVEKLMCGGLRRFESLSDNTKSLKQAFLRCSHDDEDPVIIFVSKMFAVEEQSLPQNRRRPLTQEELERRREKARQKHCEMVSVCKPQESNGEQMSSRLTDANMTTAAATTEDDMKTEETADQFIAFARVYSGVIKKGQKLFVLGPKYDPSFSDEDSIVDVKKSCDVSEILTPAQSIDRCDTGKQITCFTVNNLYLLMGRGMELLNSVPAGNVLGIGGLGSIILKSATISSTTDCPPFTALPYDVIPIVRVAVEPLHPGNMTALHRGMCLLNQADPIVEVLVQETGEHVLVGTGEVHIERCIDDLKKRYANVELKVSDPIIPFRETIVPPPKVDMVNEVIQNDTTVQNGKTSKENIEGGTSFDENIAFDADDVSHTKTGLYRAQTGNKRCVINIRACPLPHDVTKLLDCNSSLLKDLQLLRKTGTRKIKESALEKLKEFYLELKNVFERSGDEWKDAVDRIWSFGPRYIGPNVLLNNIDSYQRPSIWKNIVDHNDGWKSGLSYRDYDNSVINGFQLATSAGPLCEEPLMGVCFIIENIVMNDNEAANHEVEGQTGNSRDCDGLINQENEESDEVCEKNDIESRQILLGVLSGQIISTVKDGCRQAFLLQPARLMAAMYTCSIQTPADVLGKMYGVIAKREGRVLSEEMKEGSDVFIVNAVLPVAESFGFTEEIRKRTSGLARPLLHFTHWEVIDIDPYWVPTTEEEYLHFGDKADSENQARKYMNNVRRRKGLYIEEKIVEHAEKQRTLKK